MISLTDLSLELLQELITHVDEQDLAPLRLVSHHLTHAVDPRFFRTLILLSNRLDAGMLEGVRMENRVWGEYVREVVVAPGKAKADKARSSESSVEAERERGMEIEMEQQQRRMASALANLRNVHTVRLKITQNDPEWLMPTVFAALPHYALRTLDLIVDYADVVLPPFLYDQLETLSIVAPEVYAPRRQQPVVEGPKPPTLSDQIAEIVAQNPGLRALYLIGRNEWEDVYEVLLRDQRRLKLKTVQTDTLTPKLLAYLQSYTGLERLRLLHHDATAGSREANDKEAEVFFSSVVPRHAETLRELRCVPAFESAWGFGAWNAGSFKLLRELRTLEVGVNEWGDRAGRVEWANPIPLLLHTVRALPHLTHFSIASTMSESARGASCGDLAMSHREYMARVVEQAVCEALSESQSEFAGGNMRTRITEDMHGYRTGMELPPETGDRWDLGIRNGPKRRRRTPVEEKAWSRWTGRRQLESLATSSTRKTRLSTTYDTYPCRDAYACCRQHTQRGSSTNENEVDIGTQAASQCQRSAFDLSGHGPGGLHIAYRGDGRRTLILTRDAGPPASPQIPTGADASNCWTEAEKEWSRHEAEMNHFGWLQARDRYLAGASIMQRVLVFGEFRAIPGKHFALSPTHRCCKRAIDGSRRGLAGILRE
uniref:F-box domain-containing protein n=1 Tax=Mycena chlorophos TaxID=658473 RepID=A0ABQ0LRU4_MYCCL|nr:predicted protein [Mycena chlorophos]